mmetsp:Transcript_2436/g.6537  ORF Transcript_2436/g.6537 Transcript_2436/m.6537 type:complete len:264 (-) Transcript_2436:138-929(-)
MSHILSYILSLSHTRFPACSKGLQFARIIIVCRLGLSVVKLGNGLDHGLGQGHVRSVVPGRIVLRLGDPLDLDRAVHDVEGKALAAVDESDHLGTGGRQLHVQGLGDASVGIGKEVEDVILVGRRVPEALDALVLRPGRHDGAIVHTVDHDIVHTQRLERFLIGQVTGYLATGSGRRKGSGESHQQDVLSREAIVERDALGGKAVVEVEALGEFLADVNGRNRNRKRTATDQGSSRRKKERRNLKPHGERTNKQTRRVVLVVC